MARKKSVSRNSKKGSKQDSGLWPVIGAAVVLVLVVAAILLTAGENDEYLVVTTEQAAKEAFRARGISEIIVSDLSADFASGNYTLEAIIAKYPGFAEDIKVVNGQLGTNQNEIIVTVNGQEITQTELDTQLALLPDQYRQVLTDEQVLQEMVDEKLLLEEAARRNITITPAELELAYQELLYGSQLTEEQINENLAIFGLDTQDMRDMLERQKTIDKLFKETVDKDITPSKEDVQAYYDANKAQFQTGEEVTVKHILIANGDLEPAAVLAEAETALARYETGDDFCNLVTEYTDDLGSKDTCGEYTFPKGFMVPEFEAASFEMADGDTRIVQTQFGQHIVLKVSHQAAVSKPFANVEGDIVAILAGDKRRVTYQAFIENLRANAIITYGPPTTEEPIPESTPETASENTLVISDDTDFVPVPTVEIEEAPSTPTDDVTYVPIPVVEIGGEPTPTSTPDVPVACQTDIKQCSDGSLVVRVAPDCEFQACPPVLQPSVEVEKPVPPAPVNNLASCLKTKSVILYVADWATASMDEAATYGSMVTVEDCSNGCAAADSFPSWSINGNMHFGSLKEYELAALAGC